MIKTHKNQKKHELIDGIEHKHCYNCGRWKLPTEFNKNRTVWDGLDRKCRECYKAYRNVNKERLLAQKKQYRDANKVKIKQYKIDNKERYADYNRKYQEQYRKKHEKQLREYAKQRYQEKRVEIREKQNRRNQLPSVRKQNTIRHKNGVRKIRISSYIISEIESAFYYVVRESTTPLQT